MSLLSNKLLPPCILLLLLPAQVLARIGDPPPGFDADDAAIRTEQAWDAYNLPYGALGMVTHVFLLYCLACHLDGRSPVRPWKKLEHDIWNIANTVITSIVSISLVAVTLSGVVRQSRALTGMAVLQVLYSLVVDGVTVHRYFRDKGNDLKEREGMRWDLTPWLLVLLVASLVNSQFLGTLNEIDRNPRLNGVTGFYNTTKSTDPTGLALVICAMVGGALAVLAFLLGGCCSVFGRSGRYRSARSSLIAVYIFSFFALVSCLGFILVVDYAVGVVTGNAEGNAAKLKGKGSQAMFWTFFVFQYVPLFTF